MIADFDGSPVPDIIHRLDALMAHKDIQSNSLFQLALTLARIAIGPGLESYKTETSYALIGLIRARPAINVIQFHRNTPAMTSTRTELRDAS